MFNQLQSRPQSRSYRSQLPHLRPITRQSDNQQAQKCFLIGKQNHSRNQLQKAEKFYIQATIHNPLHYKAYCNLGLCYKVQGKYSESIGAYLKSLQINPGDDISHYNLGNVYRLIGNYEKSIEQYQRVIENNKNKQKQFTSNKNIQNNQVYLDSYNNLGVCYKMIQNYHKAVECFQNLLKIKPQDQQVLFNLAVCKLRIVRKMIKDNQQSNFTLLVKQIIQKTKIVFMKIMKNDNQNQVAKIALIELNCLQNITNQPILESIVSQLDVIIQNKASSTFLIEEATKLKAYCLSLLKKYKQSAQQYKKALQRQRQEQESIKMQKQSIKRQQQRQVKMNHDKEIQRIRKQQQQKILSQQKSIQLSKKVGNQQSLKNIPNKQKYVIKSQPPSKQLKLSTFEQKEFEEVWNQVESILVKQIMQGSIINNTNNDTDPNDDQLEDTIIEIINKNDKLKAVTQFINDKVRKQLQILSYCLLADKLNTIKYLNNAFDIYLNHLMNNNLQSTISRQLMYLSTHRVMANILTTLGYSQKAIEHYQVLSQQIQTTKQHKQKITTIKEQQLHSGLAVNYQSQGYYNKAIKQFNNAINTNPQNYTLYYNLAYCQHCENMNLQAITNYNKFLLNLQKDTSILGQQKISYQLQARISIFLCEEQVSKKIKECAEIINRLQTLTMESNISLGNYVDDQTLLKFYLPACDMFQQLIYSNNTNKQQSYQQKTIKSYKQTLFKLYISLLAIANCPDKQQIVINCGNLLFEQEQYLSALTFYQKVEKKHERVDLYNMIGVTMLYVNKYQKALQYVTYAYENQELNSVYRLNLQLLRWAFGIECNPQINQLANKYPCKCDTQFTNRVYLIKSYILKLTNYLQNSINEKDFNIEQIRLEELFKILLQSKQQKCWKSPQQSTKHNILQQIIQKHCKLTNHNKLKQLKDANLILVEIEKQLNTIIQNPTINSFQQMKQAFNKLKHKLSQTELKKHQNYLQLVENTLTYFIHYHTNINNKNQSLINTFFTQLILQQNNISQTQHITFPTQVIPNALSYTSKSFTVLYPKIELKLQNLIQSLFNWQLKLQDQFSYLIKIIQTLAYKNSIDQALAIDYNFPHCKNVQNCLQCLEKAVHVFGEMFIKQKKNYLQEEQKKYVTVQKRKKALIRNFVTNFVSQIQPFLNKSQQNPQQSILTFSLSQKNLPITISLHFPSQNTFKNFLNDLSKQLSIAQIKYQSSQQSLSIILNKLISFKCEWKQHDYINQFIENVKSSKLSLKETAILWLDDEKFKN